MNLKKCTPIAIAITKTHKFYNVCHNNNKTNGNTTHINNMNNNNNGNTNK